MTSGVLIFDPRNDCCNLAMVFDELSNAIFRVSVAIPGAELEG